LADLLQISDLLERYLLLVDYGMLHRTLHTVGKKLTHLGVLMGGIKESEGRM
jgi:hypothetical protein